MTRDEAITKLYMALMRVPLGTQVNSVNWCGSVVDGLADLGVLKLEAAEDKDRMLAANFLLGKFITSAVQENRWYVKIDQAGAYEIIDILTKSGFKITRDE